MPEIFVSVRFLTRDCAGGARFFRYQAMAFGIVVVVGGTGSGVNLPGLKMPNRMMGGLLESGLPKLK